MAEQAELNKDIETIQESIEKEQNGSQEPKKEPKEPIKERIFEKRKKYRRKRKIRPNVSKKSKKERDFKIKFGSAKEKKYGLILIIGLVLIIIISIAVSLSTYSKDESGGNQIEIDDFSGFKSTKSMAEIMENLQSNTQSTIYNITETTIVLNTTTDFTDIDYIVTESSCSVNFGEYLCIELLTLILCKEIRKRLKLMVNTSYN